jgi:hypothetical protein
MVRAHGLASSYGSVDRTAYHHQPQVWEEIRAAFDKLLATFPHNKVFRDDFEHWKRLCGKSDLSRQ